MLRVGRPLRVQFLFRLAGDPGGQNRFGSTAQWALANFVRKSCRAFGDILGAITRRR